MCSMFIAFVSAQCAFFFCIGGLPMFYNNLLFMTPEIDRNSCCECLIEFFDVVARYVVLASRYELSFNDIRECLDEYLEWFAIINSVS